MAINRSQQIPEANKALNNLYEKYISQSTQIKAWDNFQKEIVRLRENMDSNLISALELLPKVNNTSEDGKKKTEAFKEICNKLIEQWAQFKVKASADKLREALEYIKPVISIVKELDPLAKQIEQFSKDAAITKGNEIDACKNMKEMQEKLFSDIMLLCQAPSKLSKMVENTDLAMKKILVKLNECGYDISAKFKECGYNPTASNNQNSSYTNNSSVTFRPTPVTQTTSVKQPEVTSGPQKKL